MKSGWGKAATPTKTKGGKGAYRAVKPKPKRAAPNRKTVQDKAIEYVDRLLARATEEELMAIDYLVSDRNRRLSPGGADLILWRVVQRQLKNGHIKET